MRWKGYLFSVLAAGLALVAFGVYPVYAAVITVNDLGNAEADDGVCTLREAITAAQLDAASGALPGECAAGAGADTIAFAVTGTINPTNDFPNITTDITINAEGIVIDGGGINGIVFFIDSGNVVINGLTMQNGVGTAAGGGAFNIIGGTTTLSGVTLTGSTTPGDGGAIYIDGGTLNINRSAILNNTASGDGSSGGGILATDTAIVNLRHVTLSGNSTNQGGIGGNSAGGALYADGPGVTVILAYTTVSDNAAELGGGIAVNGAAVNVAASVIMDNTNQDCREINDVAQPLVDGGYNLFENNGTGSVARECAQTPVGTTLNTSPTAIDLGALADNPAFDVGWTHALDATGSATVGIDLVPTGVLNCLPGVALDQRGVARANGPGAGDNGCEPGAYEVSGQRPTAVVIRDGGISQSTSPKVLVVAIILLSGVTLGVWHKRACGT